MTAELLLPVDTEELEGDLIKRKPSPPSRPLPSRPLPPLPPRALPLHFAWHGGEGGAAVELKDGGSTKARGSSPGCEIEAKKTVICREKMGV